MTDMPMPTWAPPEGPWCLMQWIPFGVPDVKWVLCLLPPGHAADCRDQLGHPRHRGNAMFIGQLLNGD